MNMDKMTWSKIDLPLKVTHRQKHSVSSLSLSPNTVWLIVWGGESVVVPDIDSRYLVKLVFDQESGWSYSTVLDNAEICNSDYHAGLIMKIIDQPTAVNKKDVSVNTSPSMYRHKQEIQRQETPQCIKEENDDLSERPHWMVEEKEVEMKKDTLGAGSYGIVTKAYFRGTLVAAKRSNVPGSEISPHNLINFKREMGICAKLHHPNIVQFIAATDGDIPILLHELMHTSLFNRMENKRLSQKETLCVTIDIAQALAYIHAWPIIHRDDMSVVRIS